MDRRRSRRVTEITRNCHVLAPGKKISGRNFFVAAATARKGRPSQKKGAVAPKHCFTEIRS
jgi:hypothetical protein